jgi:hypothetical protein
MIYFACPNFLELNWITVFNVIYMLFDSTRSGFYFASDLYIDRLRFFTALYRFSFINFKIYFHCHFVSTPDLMIDKIILSRVLTNIDIYIFLVQLIIDIRRYISILVS